MCRAARAGRDRLGRGTYQVDQGYVHDGLFNGLCAQSNRLKSNIRRLTTRAAKRLTCNGICVRLNRRALAAPPLHQHPGNSIGHVIDVF